MLGYARRCARRRSRGSSRAAPGFSWRYCAMATAMNDLREGLPAIEPKPANDASVVASEVYVKRQSVAIDTEEDLELLVKAIKECPNMETLDLSTYSFGVEAASHLGKLLEEKGGKLKNALWADIFVSRNKPEVPVALKSLIGGILGSGANLTTLNLSDNAFGALGLESVVSYFKSPLSVHLEHIYLNNNGLGISGAKVLMSALETPPPKLKRLEIGRNRLENPGAMAVASIINKITTLEYLSLPQNGIYFQGVEALSKALSKNKNLQVLNLNDNTVGQKGAAALMEILPDLKELKVINLGDCLLKNSGAKLILKALVKPNSPNLETLDLSFNEISTQSKAELESAILWRADTLIFLEGNKFDTAFKNSLSEGACGEIDFGREHSDEEDEEGLEDEEYFEEEGEEEEEIDDNYVEGETDDYDDYSEWNKNGQEDQTIYFEVKKKDVIDRSVTNPSTENVTKLFEVVGTPEAEVIIKQMKESSEEDDFADQMVQVIFKMCASDLNTSDMYSKLIAWMKGKNYRVSVVANAFLVHLGFIKSEQKNKTLSGNSDSCVRALTRDMKSPQFPSELRDMILFVIKDKCSKEKKIGQVDYGEHKELWTN